MNSKNWKSLQIREFSKDWHLKKNRFAFSKRLNIIFQILSQIFPKLVLDVGTADGEIPFKLITTGQFNNLFIGIDISGDLIKIATKMAKKYQLTEYLQYIIADSEYLPFRETSFDCIICTAVLEHIFHLQMAIKEIARVCEEKKYAIFTIPNSFFQKVFQLLGFLRLKYKDSVCNSSNKMKNLELVLTKNKLALFYKLNYVLPFPFFLNFIEKFLIRFKIKKFHLFLNQLLICKKK